MTVANPAKVLIDWKDGQGGGWTLNDACCGVLVTGSTGGGKTSGPGQLLARAYLREGMGGLVLCAKADEAAYWQALAEREGRGRDLVFFRAGGKERFDFLAYEAAHGAEGAGQVINTVLLLDEVASVAARASGSSVEDGSGDSAFFKNALHLMLTALVALAVLSREKVTLPYLRELAASAPRSPDELRSSQWQEDSAMAKLLARLAQEAPRMSPAARADLDECFNYWTSDYVQLSERTRGILDMMFALTVTPLLYAPLRELFTSGTSSVTPEDCARGKLIVVNLSVQGYRLAGRIAALVWKHLFQLFVMRRSGENLPPVFLWADEMQNFVTETDALYQAVARSAGGATVYLTQQRDSVANVIGAGATENLFANLQTKFFCQNTGETNEWASGLIGARFVPVTTRGVGRSGAADSAAADTGGSASVSIKDEKRAFIEPSRFQSLKRGGPLFGYEVEAVAFVGGKTFQKNGGEPLPYKILTFRQR